MDGGAWWVHGVAKSRTRLGDFTVTFTFMVPGLGGPVFTWGLSGLQSRGSWGWSHLERGLTCTSKGWCCLQARLIAHKRPLCGPQASSQGGG